MNKGSKVKIVPSDDSPIPVVLDANFKPNLKRLHSSTTNLSRRPTDNSPYFVSQQNPFKRVFPESTLSSVKSLAISSSLPALAEPLQHASSLVQRPTPVPMECAEGETSLLAELDTTSDNASVPPLPSPAKSLYDDEYDDISDINDTVISNSIIDSRHPASPNLNISSFASIYNFYLSMPKEMQRATLRKLISVTDRNTLSIVSQNIVPSLRCDFMDCLPSELILKILSHLDFKSLCRAAQVSRRWRTTVDSSETIWRKRLAEDDLYFDQKDLRRAAVEEWDYTSWGTTNGDTSCNLKTFDDIYAPKINIYKAVYRRRYMIINRNWMDSRFKPKRLTITGNGGDVVTCLQFDDNQIITGSDDHSITIHNMDTGEVIRQLLGHTGGVWALQYVGNLVVSGSTDRSVRVWDTRTGINTHMFTGHTSTVRCLEVLLPVEVGIDPETHRPIMEPEHALIVTGSRDATLKVWRLPDEPSATTTLSAQPENGDNYFLRTLQGHSSSVRALSGHGNTVVSGSYDTTVRVWNVETGECKWVLTGHNQRVYSAVLDYKRNRCISGSMDWYVKVWSLDNGSLLYTLEGHTSLVGLLDLNRTTLVSAAADSTLRVWDPDNGAFLHKLEGHQGAITCFQHDEYKVVSGSENTLKLWNIKTGKLVQDLLDGLSRIWQVRFDQRKCIAAVQRNNRTYIEVLDFDQDPNLPENQNRR
ncbi:hypothetical protein D0Z03_000190 [Geotrichum reessii]|nr:hypothetical protein D0Z03_000190 [Galactomyces reessii]